MKGCELCGYAARMYCESDQASLCWTCDEKVHGANFLVAKHTRTLLCHVCQSQTPWKSSGPKLTPTVSVCERCVDSHDHHYDAKHDANARFQQQEENETHPDGESEDNDEFDDDVSDDESDGGDDDDEVGKEEEGENQVVPWSTVAAPPPPPVASSSSSSSSEDREYFISGGCGRGVMKRMRQISSDLDSDDEIECCSSQLPNEETSSLGTFRPLKQQRTEKVLTQMNGVVQDDDDHDQAESSRSTAIINSLKRLQKGMITNDQQASQTIIGICNLSRDGNH